MAKQEWELAKDRLQQSLKLATALNDVYWIAFATVKLGQISEARGDAETALARYRQGLAIFERLGMPEANRVRQMIARLERSSSTTLPPQGESGGRAQPATPQAPDLDAQLAAALAQLPPEQRAAAEAEIRQALAAFERMSPAEQAALLEAAQAEPNDQAAVRVRDITLACVRRQAPQDVLSSLDDAARQITEKEAPGSPWLEVAELCRALAALLRGESLPPIPNRYAAHFAAVQAEFKPE